MKLLKKYHAWFLNVKRKLIVPKNKKTEDIAPRELLELEEAKSFADLSFANELAQMAWYKYASIILLGLCALLSVAIAAMVPLTKTDLVVVHSASNGLVWVDPPRALQATVTSAQTESELVNYVTARESYSAFSYPYQFRLVNLLSDDKVSKTYLAEQDANNPSSSISMLGDSGTKKVSVESVVFVDSDVLNQHKQKNEKPHQNVAEVNFLVTTTKDGISTSVPYVALISWVYLGTPSNPEDKWQDWDGFTVTEYVVNSRVALNNKA